MKDTTPRPSRKGRTSFSLYSADLKAVEWLIAILAEHGLKFDYTKIICAIFHTQAAEALHHAAIKQYRADLQKSRERGVTSVAERVSVEKLGDGREKIDAVVARLKKEDILMNDSYLLRSFLRHLPAIESLVPAFGRYLAEFPDGRTQAAMRRRADDES